MNVLYIHTHDSGRILSPYGYKVPTPNLERFAGDAALFRSCFSVGATCSPSRAAMLSGTYPHQNGMLGLSQRGFSMDYDRHLVQFLNRNGYHTVLCGIQHEAGWYLDIGQGARTIGYQEELTKSSAGYRQEDLVEWDQENARAACRWLESWDGEKPFFLSYGMYATHRRFPDKVDREINPGFVLPPGPVPDNPRTREDFARYMTSVKSADTCFGEIFNCLKRTGHLDDTIVLFTTDHGISEPFCKCTLYDGGIGVALIIRAPGMTDGGEVVDGLVSHVDVFPTLCELLDLEKPDYLEGISFASMLRAPQETVRSEIFAEVNFHTSYEPIRCIRTNRYKYIRYYDTSYMGINKSNMDESMTKDYFMERGLDTQTKYQEALYDLVFDTGERKNLAGDAGHASVRTELAERLEKHMERTGDPLLKGAIPVLPNWKVNKTTCDKASSKNPDDYVSLGLGKS